MNNIYKLISNRYFGIKKKMFQFEILRLVLLGKIDQKKLTFQKNIKKRRF